jgi:hypothetical protein
VIALSSRVAGTEQVMGGSHSVTIAKHSLTASSGGVTTPPLLSPPSSCTPATTHLAWNECTCRLVREPKTALIWSPKAVPLYREVSAVGVQSSPPNRWPRSFASDQPVIPPSLSQPSSASTSPTYHGSLGGSAEPTAENPIEARRRRFLVRSEGDLAEGWT